MKRRQKMQTKMKNLRISINSHKAKEMKLVNNREKKKTMVRKKLKTWVPKIKNWSHKTMETKKKKSAKSMKTSEKKLTFQKMRMIKI